MTEKELISVIQEGADTLRWAKANIDELKAEVSKYKLEDARLQSEIERQRVLLVDLRTKLDTMKFNLPNSKEIDHILEYILGRKTGGPDAEKCFVILNNLKSLLV